MKKKNKNKASVAQPDAPLPVKHQLIDLLWRLSPAFTRWAESHMHEQGLTAQRLRLVSLLLKNGPMIMSNLSNELGVTATNVTALVDALEKEGVVTRMAHASDRRATIIELTPEAAKEHTATCSKLKDKVAKLFNDFSKTEQEQFARLLMRMREALVERKILEPCDYTQCKMSAKKKRKS